MLANTHTHCLWVDSDTGVANMDLLKNMAERIPIGGYVPSKTGTKEEITRLLNRLKKKPCLIEQLIKNE